MIILWQEIKENTKIINRNLGQIINKNGFLNKVFAWLYEKIIISVYYFYFLFIIISIIKLKNYQIIIFKKHLIHIFKLKNYLISKWWFLLINKRFK